MHDDKPHQFVDELLDASLKRYGGEEPRAGLEIRVLAGVRIRQDEARRHRLVWALAACAGVLAAVVFLLHSAPTRRHVASASVSHPVAKPQENPGSADSRLWGPQLVQGPKQEPRTAKPAVRGTKRPEQFPSPSPLTEQEKLLLAYLRRGSTLDWPEEAGKPDAATMTDLEVAPIAVAPLEIKPLDDSQSKEGK